MNTGIQNPLRTRLAKRILALFVLCALGPLAVFAVVSTRNLLSETEAQVQGRLRIEVRSMALTLVEHLRSIEMGLHVAARMLSVAGDDIAGAALADMDLEPIGLDWVAVTSADGATFEAARGPAPCATSCPGAR